MTEEVRTLLQAALNVIVDEWGNCTCQRWNGKILYKCLQCRIREVLKEKS